MTENQNTWREKRGKHLLHVSDSASRMVTERLNLEKLNLRLINLPLCSEEEAVHIEELIPRAKEGFALAMKAEQISSNELFDLYPYTVPETTTGIWKQTSLTNRQNTLPEYGHVIATIALLLDMGKVTYFDFTSPPQEIDMTLGTSETYWYCLETTPGQIWTMMDEMEANIRAALYEKNPIGLTDLLKVGHFFSAGKEIAKIFSF